MFKNHTDNELIKTIKATDGGGAVLELLERTVAKASDARTDMKGIEDSLELRKGIVQVIEKFLISPLLTEKKLKRENFSDSEFV